MQPCPDDLWPKFLARKIEWGKARVFFQKRRPEIVLFGKMATPVTAFYWVKGIFVGFFTNFARFLNNWSCILAGQHGFAPVFPKNGRAARSTIFQGLKPDLFSMIKILANDGIHPDGRLLLEEAEYEVNEQKIPQAELAAHIHEYDVLLVRSATKVTKEVIDAGAKLKLIGRGGVGLDNVDVAYAESKGIKVINTPAASSRAVAELTFAHIFALSRKLHRSTPSAATSAHAAAPSPSCATAWTTTR